VLLTNEQVENIKSEFNQWKDKMYANKTLSERQDFGMFFTPPELTIKMLEKFENLDDDILDPCCGSGNLLAAAIMAGADHKRIYGIELDAEIHKIAVERLGKLRVPEKNIICGNALDSKTYQLLPFTKKNIVFSNGLRFGKTK
jgi:protein-L-isoaspartate O-methyltransferase